MARLPEAQQANLSGVRPSADVVQIGDLGLGALAQGVDQLKQVNDQAGARAAQKALDTANQAYEAQYAKAAESYDGSQAGFAKSMTDLYDTEMAKARSTLKGDSALAAFERGNSDLRNQRVVQALDVENRTQGHIIAQQQDAARTARVANAATAFSLDTQKQVETDQHSDAMLSPDYEAQTIKAFDDRAKTLLDATPETDRAALQNALTNQRASLAADLRSQVGQLNEARIGVNVTQALTAIMNRAADNPKYLPQAALDAQQATMALPIEARMKVQARILPDLTRSAAQGMLKREDLDGLTAYLKTPGVMDHMDPDTYQALSGYVASTEAQSQRLLAQQTAATSLENATTAAMQTGKYSFDAAAYSKAYGPVEGPARAAAAQKQLSLAAQSHDLVQQAQTLPFDDFQKRMEVLKPTDPNDPDYAVKQQLYDQALNMGRQIAQQRVNDPAGSDLTAPDSQAKWQAAQAGTPGAAKAWADWTLARQKAWGIPDTAGKVLPASVAKSMVASYQKVPPEQRADAIGGLWSNLISYGPYAGRVLRELQDAGLSGEDAALIHMSNGSQVMIGQYARAIERNKTAPKLDKDTQNQVTSAADNASSDWIASYSFSTDGAIFGDKFRNIVRAMTTAGVHDDEKPDVAARKAMQILTANVRLDPMQGYRVPAWIAGQSVKVVDTTTDAEGNVNPTTSTVDGLTAVRRGAGSVMIDLVKNPGQLYPKAGVDDTGLSDDMKRQRYANILAQQGKWVTTEDESGLQLFAPDPRGGGLQPVADKNGKPIVRTWDQLTALGKGAN